MTARIGRTYARNADKSANRAAIEHFFGDRRTLFIDRRARLRGKLWTAALVVAWAAAIVGLILMLASIR